MSLVDQTSVALFVHSASDELARQAISLLEHQASSGAIDGFLSSHSENPLDARAIDGVGATFRDCHLLDELAAMRRLQRIRVVAVISANAQHKSGGVAEGMRRLREVLNQNRGAGMKIDDLRVLAPESGQSLEAGDFFSAGSNANIIVIPHDRVDDRVFARQVSAEDEGRFSAHLAIELASISALWSSMAEGPFDDLIPAAAADRDPKVVLVRSMVRALHCPGVSLGTVLSEGKPLPLPETDLGYVRSPDPEWTVERFSENAVPSEFIFGSANRPDEDLSRVDRRAAWQIYRRRFFETVRTVPHLVFLSMSEDFDVLAADAVQEAVGRGSWIQVIVPDYEGSEDSGFHESVDTSDLLRQIEFADASPIFAEVGESTWRSIVELPLGVADAGSAAASLLQEAGDHRFLVVDREYLAPAPESTAEKTILSLVEQIDVFSEPPSSSGSASEQPVWSETDDPSDVAGGSGHHEGPQVAVSNDSEQSDDITEPEITADSAPSDEAADTVEIEQLDAEGDSARDDLNRSVHRITEPQSETDEFVPLLVRIGSGIRMQQREAERHLHESVATIADIIDTNSRNRRHDVPVAMRILLALGLGVVIFGLAVFTGFARYVSLEWLDESWTKMLWILVAAALLANTVVVCWAAHARRFIRIGIVVIIVAVALILAFLPWVRDQDFVRQHVGRGRWIAWPLTAGLLLAAAFARSVMLDDDAKWRKALSRINLQATILFTYLCVIVGASSYKSFLQPVSRTDNGILIRITHLSDSTRQRLLVLFVFVGLAVTIATVARITGELVRRQLQASKDGHDLVWAAGEARRASRERRRLEMLFGQWLGTAASLSRIVWLPVGVDLRRSESRRESTRDELDLRKFEVANLELTARGTELMAERVRSSMIRRGWLRDQYQRAAEAFASMMPRVVNERLPRDEWPMPESCSSVASIKDICDGSAVGDRWSFMRALYEGDFDQELNRLPGSIEASKLFASIVDNKQHARIVGGGVSDSSAADFFDGLVPTAGQTLPVGLVKGVVFIADDPKLEMETKVVWPAVFTGKEIPERPWIHQLRHDSSMRIDGSVVAAVRIDSSRTFSLSQVAGGFNNLEDPVENEIRKIGSDEDY